MPKREPNISENAKLRQRALSRWDNEGGAVAVVHQEAPASSVDLAVVPNMTNSELAQLRVRVIALENLLITFLAEATDGQLNRIRDMATYILPRPGATDHPLTVKAAAQMINLIERADQFRCT